MYIFKMAGYLTTQDMADLLNISPAKVRDWDYSGKLKPSEKTWGGMRYYTKDKLIEALFLLKHEREQKELKAILKKEKEELKQRRKQNSLEEEAKSVEAKQVDPQKEHVNSEEVQGDYMDDDGEGHKLWERYT